MAKNFEFIGFMQNHRDVEIIKLNDGTYVALDDWNGEIYADCWTCDQSGNAIDKMAAHTRDFSHELAAHS